MRIRRRVTGVAVSALAAASALAVAPIGLIGSTGPAVAGAAGTSVPAATESSCQLGNGSKHVVEIFFDNTHFNRDNPNVLLDLEQIPVLKNFIENNGVLLSNSHTPMIAHTAVDSITDYTGLYGDRHGEGISNDYEVYSAGNTSLASTSSFGYWTALFGLNGDTLPNLTYSPSVPPTQTQVSGQPAVTPAPWVPFTRAGCDTAAVASANMELENTTPDIANIYGAGSPEAQQLAADSDSYKDQETNDYVGLGVHCAQNSAFCSTAQWTKYGQSSPSNSATADSLPTEPGGYNGYQMINGHKYLQPQLSALVAANQGLPPQASGVYPSLTDGNGYPVTDSSGNLTDLFGNTMLGQYVSTPGFPGYGPISAAQSLGYAADMLDSGVPVVYSYISDAHEKKYYPSSYVPGPGTGAPPTCTTAGARSGYGLGPGDPCYTYNLQQYNAAFQTFFTRLAAEGLTPANTTFVFASDEGDHFNGANVGRSVTPACSGTPDTTGYSCTYASGTVGEVSTNIHTLLSAQKGDTTPFYSEPQGEAIYVTGNQPTSSVRQFERNLEGLTINDPFAGSANTPVTNYLADSTEAQILHVVNNDPQRTPTALLFPQNDVYFSSGTTDSCGSGVTAANANTKCSSLTSEYLWNHGYYSPVIDTNWEGFVGPDVKSLGLNGLDANAGPDSSGANSGGPGLVSDSAALNPGIWIDHTDTRPTLLSLVGLHDDYTEDGRVLTELEQTPPATTNDPNFLPLATCYKQLNASVGQFGSYTLEADSAELGTGSSVDDSAYQTFLGQLQSLESQRDALATTIKNELWNAEFSNTALPASAANDVTSCQTLVADAQQLANPGTGTPETPSAPLLPAIGLIVAGGAIVVSRRRKSRRVPSEA